MANNAKDTLINLLLSTSKLNLFDCGEKGKPEGYHTTSVHVCYSTRHVEVMCVFSTCRASVPGCCSSFTVLPPAVFCPRPSCQVRFPPVRRLSWCLKSSGRALYSTAGLQKLKLDAAGEIKAEGIMIRQPDLHVTTDSIKTA